MRLLGNSIREPRGSHPMLCRRSRTQEQRAAPIWPPHRTPPTSADLRCVEVRARKTEPQTPQRRLLRLDRACCCSTIGDSGTPKRRGREQWPGRLMHKPKTGDALEESPALRLPLFPNARIERPADALASAWPAQNIGRAGRAPTWEVSPAARTRC